MESDQKLDKLESFLARLNSKGEVCSAADLSAPAKASLSHVFCPQWQVCRKPRSESQRKL